MRKNCLRSHILHALQEANNILVILFLKLMIYRDISSPIPVSNHNASKNVNLPMPVSTNYLANLEGATYRITSQRSEGIDFYCNYEETDSQMFAYIKFLYDNICLNRIIFSPDSDVTVISLYQSLKVPLHFYSTKVHYKSCFTRLVLLFEFSR